MFGQLRLPRFLVTLVGVAALSSVSNLSRADIILTIAPEDLQPGVIACLGSSGDCAYAPATENPAMAIIGGIRAALSQNGSFIRMAFTLQDGSGQSQYASTAITPTFPHNIAIKIVGTAGEPIGTPVLLQLSTGTDVDPGTAEEITNFLDNTNYPAVTDQLIRGFSVGDTFSYWASIAAAGSTPMIFQVDLSVQGVGIAVPTPGTLALLMIGGLALGAVSRAGGRRVNKLAENAEGS